MVKCDRKGEPINMSDTIHINDGHVKSTAKLFCKFFRIASSLNG